MIVTNEEATKTGIGRALAWMKSRNAKKGDKLFVYLAGHTINLGAHLYFFLSTEMPAAEDVNEYYAVSPLDLHTIKSLLKMRKADGMEVTLVMDASRASEKKGYEAVLNADGIDVAMISSGQEETSMEGIQSGGGHGLFTWHLVNGMVGMADINKDGLVTLKELSSYVKENVGRDLVTQYHGHQQNPEFYGPGTEDIVISKVDAAFLAKWKEEHKQPITKAMKNAR
jgi:hypothetical protein